MPSCGNAAYLLAQVDQRAQRPQLRVAHVDVAADMLDAAGELPAQDLPDPGLHVLVGQVSDPLGPHRDALEQRAGHVRPRLADGEDRVEVDVRLDQGRCDQPPAQVNELGGGRARVSGDQPPLVDAEIGQRVLPGHPGVAKNQVDHLDIMAGPAGCVNPRAGFGHRQAGSVRTRRWP